MTEHDRLFILAPKRKSSFQQISKSSLVSGHMEKRSAISKLGGREERIWRGGLVCSGEVKDRSLTARSSFL